MRPIRIFLPSFMLLLTLWPARPLLARDSIIDSLEKKLNTTILPSIEKIDILNILAREYVFISFTKSFSLADSALKLSIREHYPAGQAHACRILGSLSANRGLYGSAFQFLEKSRVLFHALGDSAGMANYYVTLGHTYKLQKNYPFALKYHRKSLTLFRKAGNKERIGVCLLNVAESEMMMGHLQSAETCINESILLLKKVHNHSALTVCYRVQGMIAFKRGQLAQADSAFQQAIRLTDSLQAHSHAQYDAAIQVYLHLAQIARVTHQNVRELDALDKAVYWANKEEYPRYLREAYLGKVNYYLRNNQHTLAAQAIDLYKAVDDSIVQRQNRDLATLLNTSTQVIRMEAEIAVMKAKADEHKKNLRQQAFYTSIAVIALLISLVLLGFMLVLYRERNRLALTMQQKTHELQTLNATKDKFFGIVAHDLKSPIKALQGVVGLVARDALPAEALKTAILTLDRDIGSTLAFADNLILWAKSQMEKTEPAPEAIEMALFFQTIIDQLRAQCEQKQIALQLSAAPGLKVWGDPHQVEFVLRNLVSNAIKFTWPGGQIAVKATQTASTTCIEVKDNGIGITGALLPVLFDVGTRSTPGTLGEKGTGLGLVLCKEFVQQNNGSITVTSEAGQGATFTVCFPCA